MKELWKHHLLDVLFALYLPDMNQVKHSTIMVFELPNVTRCMWRYPCWWMFCKPPLPFPVLWCLLSGWGRGGGRPASEPVLARHQPQAPHLPLNHTHRPPPVDNAAWCQEGGVWRRVLLSQSISHTNAISFGWISVESLCVCWRLNSLFSLSFPLLPFRHQRNSSPSPSWVPSAGLQSSPT